MWVRSKVTVCHARDACSIPGSGRSLGAGHGNPVQYSWLDNPVDRGAWRATVHRVTQSRTQLSNWAHTYLNWQLSSSCKKDEFLNYHPQMGSWPPTTNPGDQSLYLLIGHTHTHTHTRIYNIANIQHNATYCFCWPTIAHASEWLPLPVFL